MAAIIDELDDHGFADTPSNRKIAIVNSIVWRTLARADFPFLDGETDIALSAGSNVVTLPADYLRPVSLTIRSEGVVLAPDRLQVVNKKYVNQMADTGTPFLYYPVGDSTHASGYALRVFPIPDNDYTLHFQYRKQQTELSSSSAESAILIPKRHHRELIVNGALSRLYAMEDDPENSGLFRGFYDEAVAVLMDDLSLPQSDRPDYIDVPNWDDWDY